MTPKNFLFTSESVTEGHPDKVCDQISDAILDEFLTKDNHSRVAAETTVTTGMALVCGEITADCYVDIPQVVRNTIKNIGYVGSNAGGFDANTCAVLTSIDEQSTDIGNGVNKALESRQTNADTSTVETEEIGAGDQGIMFGYACNETPELMPLPISLAHKLSYRLAQIRKEGLVDYLRPDGKSQVTVEYVDGKPSRIHTILISTQHNPTINGYSDNEKVQDIIKEDLKLMVIDYVFKNEAIKPDENTIILINPSGRFVIGGPQGDSGLTGRKIIVDTYGGYSRHGGGAFSGKDPTIMVDTFGTGKISDDEISKLVSENFDLTPAGIIKKFDLRNLPSKNGGKFYQLLAAYGHMGRTDIDVPWEHIDKADILRDKACSCGCSCN